MKQPPERVPAWFQERDICSVGFGGAQLPPAYFVIRADDHTMWIRLTESGQDWDLEGHIHWDRWASFRGAWAHYRQDHANEKTA